MILKRTGCFQTEGHYVETWSSESTAIFDDEDMLRDANRQLKEPLDTLGNAVVYAMFQSIRDPDEQIRVALTELGRPMPSLGASVIYGTMSNQAKHSP